MNRFPERGEIYLVNLDPTIGAEINKPRPVLIISNNINNEEARMVTVLPITSNVNKVHLFETFLQSKGSSLHKDSKVKCNQIRTIDKRRLIKFIGRVDDKKLKEVEGALLIHLGIDIYE